MSGTINISYNYKVVGYKISIQKSVPLLYNNNELSEKEIKKIAKLVH